MERRVCRAIMVVTILLVTTIFCAPTYSATTPRQSRRVVRAEAKRYREFLYLLHDQHLDTLDYHALTERAIDGALSLCDPYSRYLPKAGSEWLREEIESDPIEACYMVDSTTIALKVARFSRNTAEITLSKYREMGSPQTLVLDLRGNQGGLVREAIKTAELFLDKGDVILSRKGRTIPTQSHSATTTGELRGVELFILIDNETASASEIVVGALNDHKRAIIAGERSFGKGLILKQYYFRDGSLALIATAHYLTPNCNYIQSTYEGRNVNKLSGGIKPMIKYNFSQLIDLEELKHIREKYNEMK